MKIKMYYVLNTFSDKEIKSEIWKKKVLISRVSIYISTLNYYVFYAFVGTVSDKLLQCMK